MGFGIILAIVFASFVVYSCIGTFVGTKAINMGIFHDDTGAIVGFFFWPVLLWFMITVWIYRKTLKLK